MALIRCPSCDTLMDATQVAPAGRQPVLLDACFNCGAIWFDRTELTRASRIAPVREATPYESSLSCPRCAGAVLFEELLGGERELAFACYRCKGVLVTGEGVDRALKLYRTGKVGRAAEPPRDASKDLCQRCGAELSWRETHAMCRSCRDDLSLTGSDAVDEAVKDGALRALWSLFE